MIAGEKLWPVNLRPKHSHFLFTSSSIALRRSGHVRLPGGRFCGFDDVGLVGVIDELWLLASGDLPTVVFSGRKLKVGMCSGDDFVSMARALSLATDTKTIDGLKFLTEGFVVELLLFVGGLEPGCQVGNDDKFCGGRPRL